MIRKIVKNIFINTVFLVLLFAIPFLNGRDGNDTFLSIWIFAGCMVINIVFSIAKELCHIRKSK